MAEAEADALYRDGPGVGVDESPADAQKEQLPEADGEAGGGISQLLEHNNALRRNFDNLKQLHLRLVEANAQLQEAFLSMKAKKARVEVGLMHNNAMQHQKDVLEAEMEEMKLRHAKELNRLRVEHEEISSLAVKLEKKNMSLEKMMTLMKGDNKELNKKLEVMQYGHDVDGFAVSTQMLRLGKDDTLTDKHTTKLKDMQELSLVKVVDQIVLQQAADLAHRVCKHLEIDLEKAISAGEAVHLQLVALTYEKDATIMDLERTLHRLKEENKLKHRIQEEADKKLKESSCELMELRTLLNALEKSSAAAEAQHLKTIKAINKECSSLRKELEVALAAQKEAADHVIDIKHLCVQLEDALVKNHESAYEIAEYRKAKDELDKKIELLRLELAEAIATRGKEQAEHIIQVQNYQSWTKEKIVLQKREDRLVDAMKKEFRCKYRALKKRSKCTSKLLATMTTDHNQLIIQMQECKAQLAIAQTTRFQAVVDISSSMGKTPFRVEAFRSGVFEEEMKELNDRQAKYFVGA